MCVGDRIRSATLSLDGLLDYDESDKDEATFELSLFAESFQDMLSRDYGQIVYDALQAFRSDLHSANMQKALSIFYMSYSSTYNCAYVACVAVTPTRYCDMCWSGSICC